MSNSSTVKDLTAGTVGGIAQVFVGQPFDIVKVRMQAAPRGTYGGMLHCAREVLGEGPLAFYKGTLTPLLGIGVCVSIQFGVLEWTKRFFTQQNIKQKKGGPDGKMLTGPQLLVAGAAAGIANGFVSGPVEHIRIRLQIQSSSTPIYAGPMSAIRQIWAQHGLRGIYKGQSATFGRESIGYAAYFYAYETLIQREMLRSRIKREEIAPSHAVLYGAVAGYALWFLIYPIDVIKTRMQSDGFGDAQKYKSTIDCLRKTWQADGIAAFTGGLKPTLIRSPFANGATFMAFELAMRVLNS